MRAKLVLNRNRKRRIEAGHPWVYQSEVNRVEGEIEPDGIIEIVNHQGVFLGLAMYNPNSQMVARIVSYNQHETIDEEFFVHRISQAYAYRRRFLGPSSESCRVVYGEADFLPGLIVDKYRDVLSVQILSLGMERFKESIRAALVRVFEPRGIFLRNDVPVRRLEGLPLETGVWMGEVPDQIEIEENKMRFLVDIPEGQKTGYFFDQRENRAAIAPLMTGWMDDEDNIITARNTTLQQAGHRPSRGADVLECFCHTGAFTVHAAKYGARHVTAVDISEPAIHVAQTNAVLNEVDHQVDFVVANAFDFLRDEEASKKSYDVVILDPPAFAKSKRALEGALRGYKEINLRGLKLVRDGGFLVTASCSYHLRPEMFRDVILDAALDAHKVLRLVHWAGAGKDHPEIAGVDEGHYLKFAIYEVCSR